LYDLGEVLACKGIAEGGELEFPAHHRRAANFILTLYEKRVAPEDLPFFHRADGSSGASGRRLSNPGAGARWPGATPAVRPAGGDCHLPQRHVAAPHRAVALCQSRRGARRAAPVAGASFAKRRPNDLAVVGWRRLYEVCAARAGELQQGLAAELGDELAFLEAAWPQGLPIGVIHADLFPDNVFFRDRDVSGLIDFYFACTEFSRLRFGRSASSLVF